MIKWIILICISALGAGYYLEYVEHLNPCLLCVMQRGAFYATGFFAALLYWLSRHKFLRITLHIGMLVSSCAGLYFAGKQLYLESLPIEQRPACTVPLDVLIRAHEWGDALLQVISGTSDCGTKQWVFLNMSLPFWSGCIFLVLIILAHTHFFSYHDD